MADTIALVFMTDSVTLSPNDGYTKPGVVEFSRERTRDGTLYQYRWFNKLRWEIPISFIPSSIATVVNSWWSSGVGSLFLYPDMINSPTASYEVRIVNAETPLGTERTPYWEDQFHGMLFLEQV